MASLTATRSEIDALGYATPSEPIVSVVLGVVAVVEHVDRNTAAETFRGLLDAGKDFAN